jgi:hypothetical protein
MADREESEDRELLLRRKNAGKGRSRYGSVDNARINNVPAENNCGEEDDDEEEEEELDNSDQTSIKSGSGKAANSGCCSAVHGRDSYHRRLLVFDILVICLGVVTSGILFLELKLAYGQCIIGMPLYEGGLLTRGVKRFWCRCPLYTIMLTSTVPWVSIMVNWVSDLFSKKCAFGKWLKWQAIITCLGAGCALAAAITSVWGFGNWCTRVIHSMDSDDMYTTTVAPASNAHRVCYSAAKMFDSKFSDEFVKLKHTFWFTLGIMILQLLLIVCWAGSCYYSVRMWARLPKDSFFAQMLLPPGISPRDRSGGRRNGGQQFNEAGSIVTDQMTTAPTNVRPEDGSAEIHARVA